MNVEISLIVGWKEVFEGSIVKKLRELLCESKKRNSLRWKIEMREFFWEEMFMKEKGEKLIWFFLSLGFGGFHFPINRFKNWKKSFPLFKYQRQSSWCPELQANRIFSKQYYIMTVFLLIFLLKLFAFIFILSVFLPSPNDQSNLQEKEKKNSLIEKFGTADT